MHHPYQRLALSAPGAGTQFLLAASGHKLFAVNLADGSVISQWPHEEPIEAPEAEVSSNHYLQGAWMEEAGRFTLLFSLSFFC